MITRRLASAWVAVLVGSISALPAADQPGAVRIMKAGEGFRLECGGAPFFIEGAVGGEPLELSKASGGNAVRTDPSGLDRAQKPGTGLPGRPAAGQSASRLLVWRRQLRG